VLAVAQVVLLAQPVLVLRRVAAEVRDVESGRRPRLERPYPRELRPLTENLNALLDTERANAEQYSRALGDLAHSLKTPLAVLNSQIDAGERPGPAELRETVQQMQARIRAELDRAARSGRRTMLAAIDPVPIAERVSRSLAKLYPETDFAVEGPAGLRANVAERDLYELLGNLLENAAKYGGGCVRSEIRALPTGGRRTGLLLTVEDDGPGMDPERFDAMLQRGVRGDEAVEGQGFGLAIVRRIVDSYHGAIRPTRSALGGLRLEVELRPA
jgi:two-component system sensor histidine kinase PhoQ